MNSDMIEAIRLRNGARRTWETNTVNQLLHSDNPTLGPAFEMLKVCDDVAALLGEIAFLRRSARRRFERIIAACDDHSGVCPCSIAKLGIGSLDSAEQS